MSFSLQEQNQLLSVAKQTIEYGLRGLEDESLAELSTEDAVLNARRATFVTLNKAEQLRGCIGTLEAVRPLIEDVAYNAFNAAFRDPRFSPLASHELDELNIGISALTQPEEMSDCARIDDLLDQLQPYEDGLIISDGYRRATFLPSVWEQLPDKGQFVLHLMRKAGIGVWSDAIRCERYRSFSFGCDWNDINSPT